MTTPADRQSCQRTQEFECKPLWARPPRPQTRLGVGTLAALGHVVASITMSRSLVSTVSPT